MEIRQLYYFVALAEELHFQRAARRVNLTQPALSYQLKSLEQKLQSKLISRDRRNVNLTPAGEHLYQGAKLLLQQVKTLEDETRTIAGQEKQKVTIGYAEYLNLDIVITTIMRTKAFYPNTDIDQLDIPTNQICNAVKEGQIDIGFAPLPVNHPTVKVKPIINGYWCLVAPQDNAFSQQDNVAIEKLDNQPLILFDHSMNPDLFNWWMTQFENNRLTANVVFETKQVATALRMVENGVGLYVVASYIVPQVPEGLVKFPIAMDNNTIEIGAVWHADNKSQALGNFLSVLRQQCEL